MLPVQQHECGSDHLPDAPGIEADSAQGLEGDGEQGVRTFANAAQAPQHLVVGVLVVAEPGLAALLHRHPDFNGALWEVTQGAPDAQVRFNRTHEVLRDQGLAGVVRGSQEAGGEQTANKKARIGQ